MTDDHVLRFPATPAGFREAVPALRLILDGRSLHPRHRHDIELVFDEVATNIVNHGQATGPVEARIRFDGGTTLIFEDDGVAFDPRSHPAPPAAVRRADLRIGGLGLVIVRELCSRVDYVRTTGDRNRLTLAIPAVEADVDPTAEIPARR
jgi:anti-sigma regulatory factor (Ser/Thr protein kinase)